MTYVIVSHNGATDDRNFRVFVSNGSNELIIGQTFSLNAFEFQEFDLDRARLSASGNRVRLQFFSFTGFALSNYCIDVSPNLQFDDGTTEKCGLLNTTTNTEDDYLFNLISSTSPRPAVTTSDEVQAPLFSFPGLAAIGRLPAWRNEFDSWRRSIGAMSETSVFR